MRNEELILNTIKSEAGDFIIVLMATNFYKKKKKQKMDTYN